MGGNVAAFVVIMSLLLLVAVLVAVRQRHSRTRYTRDVQAWAGRRGFTYRPGAGWAFTVEGTHAGRAFTLIYDVSVNYIAGMVVGHDVTSVVIPLRKTRHNAQVKRGHGPALRHFTPLGHAAFDAKFRVRTDAPGGPGAVAPRRLADAHAAGEVPLWTVRDQQLKCHAGDLIRVENLDETVRRAVRVAELLDT